MKAGVPLLNHLLALTYFAASALLLFLLKAALRPQTAPASPRLPGPPSQSPSFKLLALSWCKKYTLVSAFTATDRKYLLKEGLVLATYSVACFSINRVILWPVTLVLFLLPVTVFLFEVVIKRGREAAGKASSKQEVLNVLEEGPVQVEAVGIEIRNRQSPMKEKTVPKQALEVGIVVAIVFVSLVLFSQSSMLLADSVSNSGELNLLSLLSIFPLDQFLIRPAAGLLLLAVLRILQHRGTIDLESNLFVAYLCQEELANIWKEQQAHRAKLKVAISLEVTETQLKAKEQGSSKEQLPSLSAGDNFLDLDHFRPCSPIERVEEEAEEVVEEVVEEEVREEVRRQSSGKNSLQAEVLFTSPEKQLFEGWEWEESHPTIMRSGVHDKENTEAVINCSKGSESSEGRQFGEFMATKEPLQELSNGVLRLGRGRKGGRRNKRVLRVGGNSPYLEYLPNMLKKVDNYKHITKEVREPKVL